MLEVIIDLRHLDCVISHNRTTIRFKGQVSRCLDLVIEIPQNRTNLLTYQVPWRISPNRPKQDLKSVLSWQEGQYQRTEQANQAQRRTLFEPVRSTYLDLDQLGHEVALDVLVLRAQRIS